MNIEYYGFNAEQEVSSKKVMVEAKLALLSLKKDSGIVKEPK